MITAKLQEILEGVILALLVLVVYLFTVNPVTSRSALTVFAASFLFLGAIHLFQLREKRVSQAITETKTFKVIIFALVTGVLLWVGNTGWFLSPFFYLLYLLGISLAFLFSPSVSFSFILVLIGVLLPNMGTIESKISITSLASLLLIIPLSYFLRREYLRRVEKEKKILILETQHKAFANKVEEILSNKVTRVSADLREPLNDVRLLAMHGEKLQDKNHRARNDKKLILLAQTALKILKDFEEQTTGKILVKSPN